MGRALYNPFVTIKMRDVEQSDLRGLGLEWCWTWASL